MQPSQRNQTKHNLELQAIVKADYIYLARIQLTLGELHTTVIKRLEHLFQ